MVAEFQFEKSFIETLVHEPVSEFLVKPGCKEGDGMAGVLYSISIKTVSGKKFDLIYKGIDKITPSRAEFAIRSGIFDIEKLFYLSVVPMLNELGTSQGFESPVVQIPNIQDCYNGEDPMDNYLCMQDIRLDGYEMVDKYVGLGLDETMLVMKEIAKFHALTYTLIRNEGEKIFTNLFQQRLNFWSTRDEEAKISICTQFYNCMKNGIEMMEKRNPKLGEKMKTYFAPTDGCITDPKIHFPIPFGTDVKYFPVICHGDLWTNNIMFKYTEINGTRRVVGLKFLDFQMCRRGNIFEDLQYFIFTSTTPAFRAKHLVHVLSSYYDFFVGTLEQLNVPKPIGFTKGSFFDSFHEEIPSIFRYMFFAIPLQLGLSMGEAVRISQENNTIPTDIPPMTVEEQQEVFKGLIRLQLELSPTAIDRLEAVSQEMADLKII